MKKYSNQPQTGLRLAELTTANRKPCFATDRKTCVPQDGYIASMGLTTQHIKA